MTWSIIAQDRVSGRIGIATREHPAGSSDRAAIDAGVEQALASEQ